MVKVWVPVTNRNCQNPALPGIRSERLSYQAKHFEVEWSEFFCNVRGSKGLKLSQCICICWSGHQNRAKDCAWGCLSAALAWVSQHHHGLSGKWHGLLCPVSHLLVHHVLSVGAENRFSLPPKGVGLCVFLYNYLNVWNWFLWKHGYLCKLSSVKS